MSYNTASYTMSFDERAKAAIQEIVRNWTKKFLYNITLIDNTTPEVLFMVEFSLPTASKPIPIATVQVYFFVKPAIPLEIKFRFEKDSLIHTPDQTLRSTQMENWIESLLNKKLLVRQNVFYLGTQYERSRVRDARQDKILEIKEEPQKEEYVYLHPELLKDQRRSVEMDARTLSKDFYKQVRESFTTVDKCGLGVVTVEEFREILSNLQLKLDENEINETIRRVDKNNHGLIKFQQYREVADEISKMMIAKEEAVDRLRNSEEEYEIESIMMLVNDSIHNIDQKLSQKFKKVDEDELGFLRLPDVKKILEDLNLEITNETQESLLTLMEIEEFTKRLSERYPFAQVRYGNIVRELLQFKLNNLRKGLLESNQSLLQIHLRQQFSQRDNQQFGRIHISDLITTLEESEKIKLTKGQVYVIKSIVEKDNNDMINYLTASKSLAEVIKRMYLTHDKRREILYEDEVGQEQTKKVEDQPAEVTPSH